MAETRIVTCDRYGVTVLDGLIRLTVETGVMRDRDGMAVVDLCPDCGQKFRAFVRSAEAAIQSA